MLHRTERNLENIPVGALGIISLTGCEEMGKRVNDYIVKWRKEDGHVFKDDVVFTGYEKDNYLIHASTPRFGSGEAKGVLTESIRGKDIYLMVDVCNYSLTYSLNGRTNHMSPDDHFQNLETYYCCHWRKATPCQCHHAVPLRKPSAQAQQPESSIVL